MPSFPQWMSDLDKEKLWQDDIENSNRVLHETHRYISKKPTEIVIYRNGEAISAQTVRIETTRIEPYETVGEAGRGNKANIILIGYKDHSSIADFDVLPGDLFTVGIFRYHVRQVYDQSPGKIEAWGDAWD